MSNGENRLLVEGESDKALFQEICKILELDGIVVVCVPRDTRGTHNTKQGLLNSLSDRHLKDLRDGQTKKLAVVLDADFPDGGSGYQRTEQQFSNTVKAYGYAIKNNDVPPDGLVYAHNDGLNDIGLWVMPGGKIDGITETWLRKCINTDETALLTYVDSAIAGIPIEQKFRNIDRPKAEISTWLSWQKKPGREIESAVREGLINFDCQEFEKFSKWLLCIFRS